MKQVSALWLLPDETFRSTVRVAVTRRNNTNRYDQVTQWRRAKQTPRKQRTGAALSQSYYAIKMREHRRRLKRGDQ